MAVCDHSPQKVTELQSDQGKVGDRSQFFQATRTNTWNNEMKF